MIYRTVPTRLFAALRSAHSPSLEEVDVVELVELKGYLDGRLKLAARHFVVL